MIGLRSSLVGRCATTLSLEVNVIIIMVKPATQTLFKITLEGYGVTGGFRCSWGSSGEGCGLSRVLETLDSIRSTVIKATT